MHPSTQEEEALPAVQTTYNESISDPKEEPSTMNIEIIHNGQSIRIRQRDETTLTLGVTVRPRGTVDAILTRTQALSMADALKAAARGLSD